MNTPAAPAVGRAGWMIEFAGGIAFAVFAGACDRLWPRQPDLTLPPIADVRALYRENGLDAAVAYDGAIVEIRVVQPAEQLRHGGSLWARIGPWVYLFSPGTRAAFEAYPGITAVRVITRTGDREIARATLRNGVLSDVLWRRTLNILGRALQEGTANPARLQELAEWGERHCDYVYNPEFVPH